MSPYWVAITNRFSTYRDLFGVILLFDSLHILLNDINSDNSLLSECRLSSSGIILAETCVLVVYSVSFLQGSAGMWTVVGDLIGFPIGILLQCFSKPDGWFAAIPSSSEDCNVMTLPFAGLAFLTGEVLVFSTAFRFVIHTLTRLNTQTKRYAAVLGFAIISVVISYCIDVFACYIRGMTLVSGVCLLH